MGGLRMADVYSAYKPLRNRLQEHNLTASLEDLWALARHIMDGGPPPVRTSSDLRKSIFAWDVELLARELILNASARGSRRLNTIHSIKEVLTLIRHVEDEASKDSSDIDGLKNFFHRTTHRQFPWQRRRMMMELSRYMNVFGTDAVDKIMYNCLGYGIRELFFIGTAIGGHLTRHPGINSEQNYTHFAISNDRRAKLFGKISSSIDDLRQSIKEKQTYDATWSYNWNQLNATPLIALNSKTPNLLHCPVPELILRRISQGIYYDIYAEMGFSSAFGDAFQAYVGELAKRIFTHSRFILFAETPYVVKGNTHHGADWILSDSTANLFIECKTKRLRMDAKGALNSPTFATELGVMADAIVQLYKNIQEADEGLSHWVNNGLPIKPLVITLEDWYLFGTEVQSKLKEAVIQRLLTEGLCEATLNNMPYTVISANEYEDIASVVASVGIQDFFSAVTDEKYWGWMILDIVLDAFPDVERKDIRNLFSDVWEKVLPEVTLPG